MTNEVLALRDHLIAEQVTLVVMEATSDYWKPYYFLLEDGPFEIMLVNARHAKGLSGRKTDVSDAAWLAELGAHGLVRGRSFPALPGADIWWERRETGSRMPATSASGIATRDAGDVACHRAELDARVLSDARAR